MENERDILKIHKPQITRKIEPLDPLKQIIKEHDSEQSEPEGNISSRLRSSTKRKLENEYASYEQSTSESAISPKKQRLKKKKENKRKLENEYASYEQSTSGSAINTKKQRLKDIYKEKDISQESGGIDSTSQSLQEDLDLALKQLEKAEGKKKQALEGQSSTDVTEWRSTDVTAVISREDLDAALKQLTQVQDTMKQALLSSSEKLVEKNNSSDQPKTDEGWSSKDVTAVINREDLDAALKQLTQAQDTMKQALSSSSEKLVGKDNSSDQPKTDEGWSSKDVTAVINQQGVDSAIEQLRRAEGKKKQALEGPESAQEIIKRHRIKLTVAWKEFNMSSLYKFSPESEQTINSEEIEDYKKPANDLLKVLQECSKDVNEHPSADTERYRDPLEKLQSEIDSYLEILSSDNENNRMDWLQSWPEHQKTLLTHWQKLKQKLGKPPQKDLVANLKSQIEITSLEGSILFKMLEKRVSKPKGAEIKTPKYWPSDLLPEDREKVDQFFAQLPRPKKDPDESKNPLIVVVTHLFMHHIPYLYALKERGQVGMVIGKGAGRDPDRIESVRFHDLHTKLGKSVIDPNDMTKENSVFPVVDFGRDVTEHPEEIVKKLKELLKPGQPIVILDHGAYFKEVDTIQKKLDEAAQIQALKEFQKKLDENNPIFKNVQEMLNKEDPIQILKEFQKKLDENDPIFQDVQEILGKRHEILGICEVTKNGVDAYEKQEQKGCLSKPVISLNNKLKHAEDVMIGPSMTYNAQKIVAPYNIYLKERKALIIGYGPIGQAVAKQLKKTTEILDIDHDLGAQASVDEYPIVPEGKDDQGRKHRDMALGHAEVIFCTSSNKALQTEDYPKLRNGCLIALATSADTEIMEIPENYKCTEEGHNLYKCEDEMGKHRFYFLSKGAVNFAFLEPAVGESIYAVHGMEIAALSQICEGTFEKPAGVQQLEEGLRKDVAAAWTDYYQSELPPLEILRQRRVRNEIDKEMYEKMGKLLERAIKREQELASGESWVDVSSLEILRRRYAQGNITTQDFWDMYNKLADSIQCEKDYLTNAPWVDVSMLKTLRKQLVKQKNIDTQTAQELFSAMENSMKDERNTRLVDASSLGILRKRLVVQVQKDIDLETFGDMHDDLKASIDWEKEFAKSASSVDVSTLKALRDQYAQGEISDDDFQVMRNLLQRSIKSEKKLVEKLDVSMKPNVSILKALREGLVQGEIETTDFDEMHKRLKYSIKFQAPEYDKNAPSVDVSSLKILQERLVQRKITHETFWKMHKELEYSIQNEAELYAPSLDSEGVHAKNTSIDASSLKTLRKRYAQGDLKNPDDENGTQTFTSIRYSLQASITYEQEIAEKLSEVDRSLLGILRNRLAEGDFDTKTFDEMHKILNVFIDHGSKSTDPSKREQLRSVREQYARKGTKDDATFFTGTYEAILGIKIITDTSSQQFDFGTPIQAAYYSSEDDSDTLSTISFYKSETGDKEV